MMSPSINQEPITVLPEDEYNRILVHNVHPPNWVNPDPAPRYNLVVIGAGTAGLVTAAIGAALGAKVALIERHLMGGDCLNVGCVPSKAVIRASRVWAQVRSAGELGVEIPSGVKYDFSPAMARMRKLRARISLMDSADRYKKMGVDVFMGDGRFTGPDRVEVEGKVLHFSRAAICTGARASAPPIPGLREAGYHTNETIFSLTQLPRRMAVIGAGPIGSELAQAFSRFGSEVYVFEQAGQILPQEDPDAAEILQERMKREGVHFVFRCRINRVEVQGSEKSLFYMTDGVEKRQVVNEILVGTGRIPNVEGLGLENAGIEYDPRVGIKVNPRLQTTNPRIFAAGDVCFPFKFTHTADALAQIVVQNALFPHPLGLGYASTDSLIIPWCTYTDPEIAHVGFYEAEAKAKGIDVETFTFGLDEVDRAILDGVEYGFARVHVRKGTDKILGATIVAAHAGEMISELTLAMKSGAGLGTLSRMIHPYPTQSEVIRKVANAWRRTTLTEGKRRILNRWFAWTRR
jgi:pyruvate/2-oxoglutarate dehydrogenase complex dihydrolipoamide dehydrogenase (E3) component